MNELVNEYRTENEGPQSFSAGKLDEQGITFSLEKVEEHAGTYTDKLSGGPRPFWTAEGVDEDGNEVSLAFGSKRLHAVLMKVLKNESAPVVVNISGHGEGFDRNYRVTVPE